jgi:hypothetical protein
MSMEARGNVERVTFHCHRRCGNSPTITKRRAADLAANALDRGDKTVFI